jgi:hypothetical protein
MARFVDIYVADTDRLASELYAAGDRLSKITPPLVRRYGKELQRRVRENASGRPGPNEITGEYKESIQYKPFAVSAGLGAEVFSDAPQAFRLEYGFVGIDSAGRHYQQPPFPHFRPAIQSMSDEFYEAVDAAIGKALGR